jgi:cyclic-di-GMP phosphodiesterase TipF (flagellum assembly factor)
MVVDLLDYDVRFGQGFLFSPPRPVRAEALQSGEALEPASKPAQESAQDTLELKNELIAAGGRR